MAVEFFENDESYLKWLDSHQDGFVLNTNPSPTEDYLMLHKASCSQLKRNDKRQKTKTFSYRKVCSDTVQSLQNWADEKLPPHANLTHSGCCYRET